MKAMVLIDVIPGSVIGIAVHLLHRPCPFCLILHSIQFPEDRVHLRFQCLIAGHPGLDGHVVDILVIFPDVVHCLLNEVLQFSQFRFIEPFLGF